MDAERASTQVAKVAERFASERKDRLLRSELDPKDFAALADAGFLATGAPVEDGGLWESVPKSTRLVAEMLRAIARGDSSVALVSAMHPAVLSFWLATKSVPEPDAAAWREQRSDVGRRALDGAWWGTITSEPGSGGDVAKTKARAVVAGDRWAVSGQKHFGSGSGITSYMITTAVAEGEDAPDWFFLDVRDAQWDGSNGIKLIAPWDGHGMIATQSHGFIFENVAAERIAWPGNLDMVTLGASPFVGTTFTAVIVGIVDEAIASARRDIGPRASELRPYEQVEWAAAEAEAWSIVQIYEGMLRAVETEAIPHRHVLMGKTMVAEMAESVLRRLCRIIGGGTFGRRSPYGFWFEDVRALGFLRPPWPLAIDTLALTAFLDA